MKNLITVFALLMFVSCQTKEEKLLTKLEEHLVKNLKDPSSYELIESRLDTLFKSDEVESEIKSIETRIETNMMLIPIYNDNSKYSRERLAELESQLEKYRGDVKQLRSTLVSDYKQSIVKIGGVFRYRAKNGFGALDINTSWVHYDPNKDEIIKID
jgi:chromosome segregation ATPase